MTIGQFIEKYLSRKETIVIVRNNEDGYKEIYNGTVEDFIVNENGEHHQYYNYPVERMEVTGINPALHIYCKIRTL